MSEVLSGVNWYKSVVDLEKECKPRVNSPLLLNEAALSKASECCPHYYDKAPFSSVYTLESVLQMHAFFRKNNQQGQNEMCAFSNEDLLLWTRHKNEFSTLFFTHFFC